jgi:hypothetical protein
LPMAGTPNASRSSDGDIIGVEMLEVEDNPFYKNHGDGLAIWPTIPTTRQCLSPDVPIRTIPVVAK